MSNALDIEKLFQQYWVQSFPMAPANKRLAASHVAFAKYVLLQVEILREQQQDF